MFCNICKKDITNKKKYCLRWYETIFYPLTETFYPDRPQSRFTDYEVCKECFEIERKKNPLEKKVTYQPVECLLCKKVSNNFVEEHYFFRIEPLTGLVEGICENCIKQIPTIPHHG